MKDRRKPRHREIEAGREAFRLGVPREGNPYDDSDTSSPDWETLFQKHNEWDHGWLDEQMGGDDPIPND